ncbi:MAG: hypothetical protein NZ918_03135 [Aigarchaeota archaeon]|nr:hypothetical protein [Aigarchaeota archaeon]MDW8021745.1 hypothetical protein [Nitrososphaerota archaeon]
MGAVLKKRLGPIFSGNGLGELRQTIILYFYALSTASANPRDVVKMASSSALALGELSSLFDKASRAIERWGYRLHRAILYISKKVGDREIFAFLKRLAEALNLNMDLRDFVRIEFEKMMSGLVDEFERRLERLKKLIDAYSAILTSSIFLSVSMLLVSSIFGMDVEQFLALTSLGIFSILSLMAFLLSRSLPPDPVLHGDERCPRKLKLLRKLNIIMIPLSISASIILAISSWGGGEAIKSMTLPLFSSGIPLLIIGRLGAKWVKSAEEVDRNLPSFVKSLGDAVEVSGSLKGACKLVSLNDYGPVNRLVKRLQKRLEMGFDQKLALKVLGAESLSSLTYSMGKILADSIHHGARASMTAKAIHDYVLKRLENRKKRVQVAGMLWGIAFPLQAAFAAISALISVLVKTLSAFIELIYSWFPLIAPIPEQLVNAFFLSAIYGMAAASSVAYYRVKGDSAFSLTSTLGLLLAISGAVYAMSAIASDKIFEMATGLSREISSIVGEL